MINTQILIDRMLENENLTNNLDDKDAEWLLDWGADRLREFGNAASMEAAEAKAGALMQFMRGLNRLAGDTSTALSAGLPGVESADLAGLLEHYAAAFGGARQAGQGDLQAAAARVSKLPARAGLEYLIDWARPV